MYLGLFYQTYAYISDIKKDISFVPNTSIEDGIHQFIKWYKEFYKER